MLDLPSCRFCPFALKFSAMTESTAKLRVRISSDQLRDSGRRGLACLTCKPRREPRDFRAVALSFPLIPRDLTPGDRGPSASETAGPQLNGQWQATRPTVPCISARHAATPPIKNCGHRNNSTSKIGGTEHEGRTRAKQQGWGHLRLARAKAPIGTFQVEGGLGQRRMGWSVGGIRATLWAVGAAPWAISGQELKEQEKGLEQSSSVSQRGDG